MFDSSLDNLTREIRSSEELTKSVWDKVDVLIQRYHGPHHSNRASGALDSDPQDFFPENTYHEYVSGVVPKLIYDNPRVRVGTRRPGSQQQVAEAIGYGLNRWIRDIDFRNGTVPLAVDMLFGYGIGFVTQQPIPGMRPYEDWVLDAEGFDRQQSAPHWPALYRMSPRRFIFDSAASSWEAQRWRGHKVVRDKDDLLREARENPEAGWDVKAIEGLATDRDNRKEFRARTFQDPDVTRNEVAFYEVLVFEEQLDGEPGPDEGHNGTWHTVALGAATQASEKRPQEIRKPRPNYGPVGGNYVRFGVYEVPDSPIPLSPLVAMSAQIEELNRQARAASTSAETWKQILLADDPHLVQSIIDGKHLHAFQANVKNLRESVGTFEIGGMAPTQQNYIEMMRERVNRGIGMDDLHRGSVGSAQSATEAAIADEAASARMDFIKHQFRDAAEKCLNIASWYLYYDNRTMFPLGPDAAEAMGMVEPWFVGGDFEDGSGATHADLELEIDAYSMERTSEGLQQRRMAELTQLVMNLAPAMPQLALYTDLEQLLDKLGEQMNVPNLSDLFDTETAAQIGQAMMGAQVQQQQPPGGGGSRLDRQPRLTNDLGAMGVMSRALSQMQAAVPQSQGLSRGADAGAMARVG